MRITKKAIAVAGIAALAAVALTGCAGGGGGAATGTPILVNSITDTKAFPEAAAVATAVFEQYNAAGGYKGRPIQLKTIDAPTGDAPAAVNGAADSIGDKNVVAMVGSSTFGECAINHQSYEDAGMVAFVGVGVDTFCFTTPNMAAANNGPIFDIYATAWNAIKVDGSKAPCFVANSGDPSTSYGYSQVTKLITERTGVKWADVEIPQQTAANDYSGAVIAALGHNCDALVFGGVHPTVAAMIATVSSQGAKLPVYVQTSCYDPGFPVDPAVKSYGGKISVPAEFAPSDDAANADFNKLVKKVAAAPTWSYSFEQAGYLAAKDFIMTLEKVKGDVTRESVTAAAKDDATWPDSNKMRGNPWIFGSGNEHQANSSTYLAEIASGSGVWTSKGPWLQAADMQWTNIPAVPPTK